MVRNLTEGYLYNKIKIAKFQKIPTISKIDEILKDFNRIVNHWTIASHEADTEEAKSICNQNTYLDLTRMIYNKFMAGHFLIDGNKRMYKILSEKINKEIAYKELI